MKTELPCCHPEEPFGFAQGKLRDEGPARVRNSGSRIRHSEFRVFWASRDRKQLEEALWRYLTEPSSGRRPRARIAYAFDLWIAHLALLEQMLELAPIPWQELRAEELEGLLLLRAARERFRREYRPCADCGAPVKGKICSRCGAVS